MTGLLLLIFGIFRGEFIEHYRLWHFFYANMAFLFYILRFQGA